MNVSSASRRPGDAATPERRRVTVIGNIADLAADDAVEGRPDAVHAGLDRMQATQSS